MKYFRQHEAPIYLIVRCCAVTRFTPNKLILYNLYVTCDNSVGFLFGTSVCSTIETDCKAITETLL